MTVLGLEGPVADLLDALGLTDDGELQDDLFADPGATLKGMLHDADRRAKLLRVVQALVAEAGIDLGPAETVAGRDWLPVIGSSIGSGSAAQANHVDVSVVLDHTVASRTVVGLGVRYTHDPAGGARLNVRGVVPLVSVPLSGDPELAPGTSTGDIGIEVLLEPRIEGGGADLESLAATVEIPTEPGRDPVAVVAALGLRLGDADPVDVTLDSSTPLAGQALEVAATLLRALADAADPRLTALLRLIGLVPEPGVPPLPIEALVQNGRAALWDWVRALATPAASRGWAEALADLVSTAATVAGTGSPQDPARVRLVLGPAVLELALLLRTDPDGSPVVTPRVSVWVETAAAGGVPRLVARAEVELLALRLAASPVATAVPGLRLFARAGPDAPRGGTAALVDQDAPVEVEVGSIEAGLSMDGQRRVVPLLAAYEVRVGSGARRVDRPRVDLTDADAVADLGADTLDALVEEALEALGAGDEVRAALALVGLRDPHGFGGAGEPAWPHRTDLGALIADPLGALTAFLAEVLVADRGEVLLAELGRLVPRPGGPGITVGGDGTAASPWTLALDDDPAADVELTAWRTPAGESPLELHLGLRAAPAPVALGPVGTLRLGVDAELARLTLAPGGGAGAELAAGVAVRATVTGAPGGSLRLGDADLAVEADALVGGLRWSPAGGLRGTGGVDGLRLEVDGRDVPIALPTVDPATGALVAPDPLPWAAIEALAGHALRRAGAGWSRSLADALGWGTAQVRVALADLIADPVDALLELGRGLVQAGAGREELEWLVASLAALVGDLAPGADAADAAFRGTGTPEDPWALRLRDDRTAPAEPVTGGPGRTGELLLWCEPDGPSLLGGADVTPIPLPSWLLLGTDPGAAPPAPADLALLLVEAAAVLPEAAHLLRGRPGLATALGALRDRLAGGDGILPAAGPPPPGWTRATLDGTGHAELQATWEDAAPDLARTVFVTGPLGDPARWPAYAPERLLDLRAAGMPAEAFDLAAVAAGPGPWFVALPARAAAKLDPAAPGDGFEELAARLRRVVAAAHARAGAPVVVVAHSTAGLPARLVAAPAGSGVGRLVTLGTPLEGAQLTFADVLPTADAVLALRALWSGAGLDGAELGADLAPAATFVAALTALGGLDATVAGDLAAPAAWPAEVAGVTRESVLGVLDADAVQRTIGLAIRAGLHAALARAGALPPPAVVEDAAETEAPPGRRPVTAIATGVRHDLTSAPDPRGVVVSTRVTVMGPRLGLAPEEGAEAADRLRTPAAELRVRLHREGGWLVGGPLPAGSSPGARGPRLRWAEIVVAGELRGDGAARAEIVLHEAAALGVEHARWTLEPTDLAALPAEARTLLFRLASALGTTPDAGAIPATGASRAVVDLLAALGLATVDAGGHVGLVGEAVERLLIMPGTVLREAAGASPDGRRAIARALRALAGVPLPGDASGAPPGGPAPAVLDVTVDGARLVLDLDPLTSNLPARMTVDAAFAFAGILVLSGGVVVDLAATGPVVSGHAVLAADADLADPAPTGLPALALDLPAGGPLSVELRLDVPEGVGPGWLPRRLGLYPVADPAADLIGLLQLALATAPAELARMALARARHALAGDPEGVLLDAVLAALGLLGGASGDPVASRPTRVPLALVLDPAGWLRRTFAFDVPGGAAPAVAALIDALRGLLGLGTAATPSGHLPLPYGLDLSAVPAAGGLAMSLGTTAPVGAAGAQVEIAAGVRIAVDPALGVRAQGRLEVGVGLRPAGEPAAVATVRLIADDAVSLVLVLPGPPERVHSLYPAGPGLGDLLSDAATRLLPVVLDAVVEEAGDVGDVVGQIGDALGVRAGGAFDGAALSTFAQHPAAGLQTRLTTAPGALLGALGELAETALDGAAPGFVDVTNQPDRVIVEIAERLTLTLRGTPSGMRLDVEADVPIRVDGTDHGSVVAAVGIDGTGLAEASLGASLDGDLLTVLGVPLRPWVRTTYAAGPPPAVQVRAGLMVPGDPPAVVVATLTLGQALSLSVVGADGAPVAEDLGLAIARVLTPLLAGIVTEALQDALETEVGAGPDTVGDVLDGVLVRRVGGAAGRWGPLPELLDPGTLLDRAVTFALQVLEAFAPSVELGPLEVRASASNASGAVTLELGVSIADGETWWLVDQGDLRIGIEVATEWLAIPAADGGIEVGITIDPSHATPVRDVAVGIRGLTIRVAGRAGGDLLDLGVKLRSVAISGAYATAAPAVAGGRFALDRIAIPLGGGGGNAVASKTLDAEPTGEGSGDTERPAPALSPELSLVSRDGGPVQVDVRAGPGDGPWWLPLQAQLGPVYVEQIGFGVLRSGGTVTKLRLLVDGGVSIAGLTVQVDDLELRLPWPEAYDVSRWELDLAGLAVGYEASGVSVAGALLREPPQVAGGPPSYLGLVSVNAAGFGIRAFGGFGVYPVPNSSETYVSFFVIAALHAPLGGVPAFFLTGLGGGIGINRKLILPTQIDQLPQFALVQALDPGSDIASDPMGALRRMGESFPPERGAIWFAAGVSFTSFSVVEGVALLSVSIAADGVEIALMGLARLGLPNPRLPIAQIELALLARFSTRDMVLWIQAQLTDNSWVISEDARLTGGFAFVTWFKTGDFVVTLGGYHPDFRVEHYPQVPRLGLSWTLGEYLSIRGETYFALCSSAIMMGARLDASLTAGPGYLRITAGFNALVKFDPLYFVVDIWASITGGIRITIDFGWFGKATINISISVGASLHVEGPDVRGRAVLDLGPISIPFDFGPSGALDQAPLAWSAFRDKYLLAGGGQVLSIAITTGMVAGGGADESRNDGRDPAKPWLLLPEFSLHGATTMAAERYAGATVTGVGGLGVGPMQIGDLSSDWRVTVRRAGTGADRTGRLEARPATTGLPVAIWRALPSGSLPPLPTGAELVTGCTAVDLLGAATVPSDDGPASFDPYDVEEDRDRRKPLPFPSERTERPPVREFAGDAIRVDVLAVSQAELMTQVVAWVAEERFDRSRPRFRGRARAIGDGADPARAERERLLRRRARGWQAVPRPVRITEGLGPEGETPVGVEAVAPPPPAPDLDRTVGAPRVAAILREGAAPVRGKLRTTVTTLAKGGPDGARRLRRRAAPSADTGRAVADRAVAARLVRAAPGLARTGRTVRPADGGVPTGQAGAFAELRGGLRGSPEEGEALLAAGKALPNGGVTVVPGQVVVLALPNPHDDAQAERPRISSRGDAAVRAVALDAAGRPLADAVIGGEGFAVPPRSARVALVGIGAAVALARTEKAEAGSGLPGWHATVRVAEVVPGTAITPGAVVRGPSAARRGGIPVEAALPPAADVVRGVGLVETTLPDDLRTLVVALDRGTGADEDLDGLVLGLEGLRRRSGPDGELPPRIVAAAERTVLVYAVERLPGEDGDGTATVSVASDERWELAAVLGAASAPDRVARDVLALGVEGLLAPLAPSPLGSATVTWTDGGAR